MKAKDYIIIGGAIAIYLLWKNSKTKKSSTSTATDGGLTTGGASAMPTSNEPQQVFGLGLPSGMDLPVLTAGTGVPTEVAVQQGGVSTTPTPAIVQAPVLQIEDALELGGIKPIKRPLDIEPRPITTTPEATPIVIVPRPQPTIAPAELVMN